MKLFILVYHRKTQLSLRRLTSLSYWCRHLREIRTVVMLSSFTDTENILIVYFFFKSSGFFWREFRKKMIAMRRFCLTGDRNGLSTKDVHYCFLILLIILLVLKHGECHECKYSRKGTTRKGKIYPLPVTLSGWFEIKNHTGGGFGKRKPDGTWSKPPLGNSQGRSWISWILSRS